MIIKEEKGCLYCIIKNENIDKKYFHIIDKSYINNQKKRDNNEYHITIINSTELNKINFDKFELNIHFLNLGLCVLQKDNNEIYYLLIYSNDLNDIRKKYDLQPILFHITLGFKFNDIHCKNKSINNIILKNNDIIEDNIPEIFDENINNYLKYNYYFPKLLIKDLKKNFKKNIKDIDILIENNNYLGYIFRYQFKKNLEDLYKAIEFYNYDIHQKYDKKNIGTFNCIKVLNNEIMKLNKEYRKIMYFYDFNNNEIKKHIMPRNFSWVINNKIGGISKLLCDDDIKVLETLNIKKIYYLLEKPYFDSINKGSIEIEYIYCLNGMYPKLEDLQEVFENESFDKPILFGCLGGYGRTGTALACYLCKYGIDNNHMNSESAIQYLRNIRPKSIETTHQLNFIKQFSNSLYNSIHSSKIKTNIKFIMLVGLPGSGKTTFTELFLTSNLNINILNQDIMGRKMCENSILHYIKDKNSDITILDRVNYTIKDRKEWLKNTQLDYKQCLCIYLNTPKFICIQRVKNRKNHPTIKNGGGERIIEDIFKKFEPPTTQEGFKEIIHLEDEEDVKNYLKLWKCSKIELEDENDNNDFIHKFPRTKHIFNIGGASSDDKILSKEDYNLFMNDHNVFISEKVDGAQIGISIDDNYKIIIQNRSHYINSKSHSQFEKIDKWIINHYEDLYSILDNNTILFGEWLYATHSISYTHLPDYFLAFDLYDKKNKLFYNRTILENKLKNTNIHIVKEIFSGKIIDNNHLLKLIQQKSFYTNHKIEGIYLKIFDGDFVKLRSKLVNNDFIPGNQHWNKSILLKNNLL